MTIGELLPGYEAIVDQPKLGITEIQDSKRKMGQHVQVRTQVIRDDQGLTGHRLCVSGSSRQGWVYRP